MKTLTSFPCSHLSRKKKNIGTVLASKIILSGKVDDAESPIIRVSMHIYLIFKIICITYIMGFPGKVVKSPPAMQETHTGDSVNLFLPGESHAQRSLAVCSLCGCQASDTTE